MNSVMDYACRPRRVGTSFLLAALCVLAFPGASRAQDEDRADRPMLVEGDFPDRYDLVFNTRTVEIPWTAEDDTEIRAAELWVDRGGQGLNWMLAARQEPAAGQPLTYKAIQDGIFGFKTRWLGAGGPGDYSAAPPGRGERPRKTMLIDTLPPEITLNSPRRSSYSPGSRVEIDWTGHDEHISETAVAVEYSTDGGRHWQAIDAGRGKRFVQDKVSWLLPEGNFPMITVRVRAVDIAGNEGSATASFSVGFAEAPRGQGTSEGGLLSVTVRNVPTVVGTRDFMITYDVENRSASPLRHVSLYYKVWKNGRWGEWFEYGRDPDISDVGEGATDVPPAMRVVIPKRVFDTRDRKEQFALGLYLIGVLEDGTRSAPQPTDPRYARSLPPMVFVTVDNRGPFLELHHPQGGEEFIEGQKVSVSWYAADSNLPDGPVSLYKPRNDYAPGGSEVVGDVAWELLAENLPAEGVYVWRVPNVQLEAMRIKVVCRDQVGNTVERVSRPFRIVGRKALAERQAQGAPNARTEAQERYRAARWYISRQNNRRAVEELQAAISLWPDYVDALVSLGTLYYYADRFGDARGAYERALRVSGRSARLHYYLGLTYEQLARENSSTGRTRESLTVRAVDHFQKGATLDPRDQRALVAIARIKIAGNERSSALAVLNEIKKRGADTYWGRWATRMEKTLP